MQYGEYHAWWYTRCDTDQQRQLQQSWYGLEIHELIDGWMEWQIMIRPMKVNVYLWKHDNCTWYQWLINLVETHLVGPFDFQHMKQQHQEWNHIKECYWNCWDRQLMRKSCE
jgi:hypothetical protein